MATKISYQPTHERENNTDKYAICKGTAEGLRSTANLLIQSNGQVVSNNSDVSSISGAINLGNQGDHNVTVLHFDTHELL